MTNGPEVDIRIDAGQQALDDAQHQFASAVDLLGYGHGLHASEFAVDPRDSLVGLVLR